MDKVYLRPLVEEDASISWRWRNDRKLWKHTAIRPNRYITFENEHEWIRKVLERNDEIRFAICLKETNTYIGNVQLTDINCYDAQFHIFIGEKNCHGKGYGTSACKQIIDYGLNVLNLQSVYLDVKRKNIAAIKSYVKAGFHVIFDYDEYKRMAIYRSDDIKVRLSVFVLTYNHEESVSETLDGILKQKTTFNFDVIVGDDFSVDGTRRILVDYACKNPGKLKLLFYPRNLSAPVNQHWVYKNCSGDYIAMCEGDDYWTDENKLQGQVDFLDANEEFTMSFHDIKVIDGEGNDSDDNRQPIEHKRDFEKNELLGSYIPTPTIVFKKKQNELPSYFLQSLNGDALFLSLITQEGKAKYLRSIGYSIVRVHSGGSWSTKKELEKIDHSLSTKLIIFKSLKKEIRKIIYQKYIDFFETASIEAANRNEMRYWIRYNVKYLKLSYTASHYGKMALICKRMLLKILSN